MNCRFQSSILRKPIRSPREAAVPFRLQVVTRHPLVAQYLTQILSLHGDLCPLINHPPILSLEEIPTSSSPCLFILDAHLLALGLSSLIHTLKMRFSNGKFLALLDLCQMTSADMVRLLYLGVHGLVKDGEDLHEELPLAVREILAGNLWAPAQILADYVKFTNMLLENLCRPDRALTARENQILAYLIRRLTNKEIAESLSISERTVKFHVSNMLAKLRCSNRSDLRAALEVAPASEPENTRPSVTREAKRLVRASGTAK